MRFFRGHILVRIINLIMAIQIANIGIDPPDVLVNIDNDIALEEDLSINDIESIVEFTLEEVMDIEDAIPETDDPESDSIIKKVDFYSFIKFSPTLIRKPIGFISIASLYDDFLTNPSFDILSPPPRVA